MAGMMQVYLCPQTEAEEHIMGMPATEAVLEALGLRFADGDDPSVWRLHGSIQALQDKLACLLVQFRLNKGHAMVASTALTDLLRFMHS